MIAWFCTGWVAGCLLLHQLAALPQLLHGVLAGLGLFLMCVLTRNRHVLACILCTACGLAIGVAWSTWSASNRLADALDPGLEGFVTRVSLRVTSIVKVDAHGQQFDAVRIGEEGLGVPRHLLIRWPAPFRPHPASVHPSAQQGRSVQMPVVKPGQVWRAALVLKRPRTTINPHLFDSEAHWFARQVRAIGTIRGQPRLVRDDPWSSLDTIVQRTRQRIRSAMQRAIGEKRFGPVLIALAVGDQNGVDADDWRVFNLAGITHLVSISGSHVTLMAAWIARLFLSVWKRASWRGVALSAYIPAKSAAGCVAIVTAFLYCLLAGWGVPAQRTFFMLLVAWLAWTSRLRLSAHQVLSFAAVVVLILDPWSVLSTGFWLSFGAVWVLWMASQSSRRAAFDQQAGWAGHLRLLSVAIRLQWVISLSLVPILCWLFQQVSFASPLANAVAIPVVTLVVTPLSLLLAVVSMVEPLSHLATGMAWIAHTAFEWMMVPVGAFAMAQWALVEMPAFPFTWLATAVMGLAWSLQPRGVPARWAGWLWMSMALCWMPSRPRPGEWRALALDVGQASAVLIITHQQAMLFDAGGRSANRDDGERIVLPVLRALGVRKLDTVVISHEDRDHIGGLAAILRQVLVSRLVGAPSHAALVNGGAQPGHSEVDNLARQHPPGGPAHSACHRGLTWEMDKVRIEVLHPEQPFNQSASSQQKIRRNHHSCVISVSGQYHSILLTGDITAREESRLVAAGMTRADVVLAPHHGSDTSSSPAWVDASGARHVIVQSGWLNRFGHPASQVVMRWRNAGAELWRTDRHGAIWVQSQEEGLHVIPMRRIRRRYWHFDD